MVDLLNITGRTSKSLISAGVATLHNEAAAINDTANCLDENFLAAINVIMRPETRVAVSGMGKSGHIGRKIAATLASTGTPAYFVHPAEAGHGDLGMICHSDTLLAISNSGSSAELNIVLDFVKRRSIPVIGITHVPDSPLGRQADICLLVAYENEACPIGCAPTASTTAALALGDALAMALLTARGFSARDFNEYHPGGALGRRLLLVGSIMRVGSKMPLVHPDASMPDVLLEMTVKGLGCAGVIDESCSLSGIITDGDLRRNMKLSNFMDAKARDIMTAFPHVISAQCAVAKAISVMEEHAITSLFVVENGQPVGIVNMRDCLANSI